MIYNELGKNNNQPENKKNWTIFFLALIKALLANNGIPARQIFHTKNKYTGLPE
jgi:hypothetical protein